MSETGHRLYSHVETLFPICRSITGEGLRQTLRYIGDHIPLEMREVASGTKVLDWEVPREWNVRGATLKTVSGETVIDFADNNLHLVQYSKPINETIQTEELNRHLHSLPDQPELIPYRTGYYADNWGFCLPHRLRQTLTKPAYQVSIDTILAPGSLSYGEAFYPGEEPGEVLISVHCCHPSLANDNLSSIAVAIELAHWLAMQPRRFSYRFVFIPGTIGAITWLHFNLDAPNRIRHGLVLSCLGDAGPPTWKRSRRGNAAIDRYMSHLLRAEGQGERILPFIPYGYDERQYGSPGFNLPVGCLMRSPNGTFPEYHTSADNLSFVQPQALADSLRLLQSAIGLIERDRILQSTSPYGEPQLGRRGLYRAIGGQHIDAGQDTYDQMTLLWVLNLADGDHSLLDMAERSGAGFSAIAAAAAALSKAGLLVDARPMGPHTSGLNGEK